MIIDLVAGATHSGSFYPFGPIGTFLLLDWLDSGFYLIFVSCANGGVNGLLELSMVNFTGSPPDMGI